MATVFSKSSRHCLSKLNFRVNSDLEFMNRDLESNKNSSLLFGAQQKCNSEIFRSTLRTSLATKKCEC